jgi:hypothetical protein
MSYIKNDILNLQSNDKFLLQHNNDESGCHQKTIICYCRSEDDIVKEVSVNLITGKTSMKISDNISIKLGNTNPSCRRQGITIKFSSENGNDDFNLNIFQHKGYTYIETIKPF